MSRLRFEWREDRGRACFLGNARVGVVRSLEGGFLALSFVPGAGNHKFNTFGEAEAEIERRASLFVSEAGLVPKEAIECSTS